jgi:hypothetical protein
VPEAQYEIVVKGRLGGPLTRWFEDLEVRSSGSDATYLRGWFADQSALQGLLTRFCDLGLDLASLRQLPDAE